jgi:glycosyltransferase involved in cell wall biosynthesis
MGATLMVMSDRTTDVACEVESITDAAAGSSRGDRRQIIDLSVVMPCLNEEESVGICVQKAWEGIRRSGLRGEVIIADNGSTDNSVAVARGAGARVIHQPLRGYGNAYLAGFAAARGKYIAMGDSDDSYDFTALPELVAPLQDSNCDYVLGSRMTGEITKGAMSWSHRYIGNPVLTTVLNILFKLRVSDAHSGFRVFTRDALDKMNLQTEGMEFASEIVVKAASAQLRVTEVPITYTPRIGDSKLNSLSDGWRHLRYLFILSPKFLFLIPGFAFLVAGLLGTATLFSLSGGTDVTLAKVLFAFAVVIGVQFLVRGVAATVRLANQELKESNRLSSWVTSGAAAKQGFGTGAAFVITGVGSLIYGYLVGWGVGNGVPVSLLVFSLLLIGLGVTLWSDAFFLGLFEDRKTARPALHLMTQDPDNFIERRQQSRRLSDVEASFVKLSGSSAS